MQGGAEDTQREGKGYAEVMHFTLRAHGYLYVSLCATNA